MVVVVVAAPVGTPLGSGVAPVPSVVPVGRVEGRGVGRCSGLVGAQHPHWRGGCRVSCTHAAPPPLVLARCVRCHTPMERPWSRSASHPMSRMSSLAGVCGPRGVVQADGRLVSSVCGCGSPRWPPALAGLGLSWAAHGCARQSPASWTPRQRQAALPPPPPRDVSQVGGGGDDGSGNDRASACGQSAVKAGDIVVRQEGVGCWKGVG